MTPPMIPEDVIVAETRRVAEAFDDWDSAHTFVSYSWDGTELSIGLLAVIDPGMDPDLYPEVLADTTGKYLHDRPDDSPAAYMLQFEGFGVIEPPATASAAEKQAFQEARVNRTFHELPDATEYLIILVADVYGRVWQLRKNRTTGELSETFHHSTSMVSGIQTRGLRTIALATGMTRYGMVPGSVN